MSSGMPDWMSDVGENLVVGCQNLTVWCQKIGYDQSMYELYDVVSHDDDYCIHVMYIIITISSDMSPHDDGVCIGCQALVKIRLLDVRTPTTLCQKRGYYVNTGRHN